MVWRHNIATHARPLHPHFQATTDQTGKPLSSTFSPLSPWPVCGVSVRFGVPIRAVAGLWNAARSYQPAKGALTTYRRWG
jgi:hypothetical protein